jgi:hypothetical protein
VIQEAHRLARTSVRITAEVGFYMHAAHRFEAEMPMLKRAVAQDARFPLQAASRSEPRVMKTSVQLQSRSVQTLPQAEEY